MRGIRWRSRRVRLNPCSLSWPSLLGLPIGGKGSRGFCGPRPTRPTPEAICATPCGGSGRPSPPGPEKEPEFRPPDNISLPFHATPEVWVDASQVGRASLAEEGLEGLLADVSAYGGELLPGFYDEWVILERERLRAWLERRIP